MTSRRSQRGEGRVRVPHRRARARERASAEDRFRLLVESVTDYAIFMLDPDGRVASWNPGAERLKGYAPGEILGRHFSVFYPPDVVASGFCDLELATAARDGRHEDEGWRVRKDGSRFWAAVVITAMHDSRGRLRGFAKVTRDLTERRRAEEERVRLAEAQAALRLRDEFLALASHELRTPVTALRMQVQGLQRKRDALDASVAKLVGRATDATDRLVSLVDVLLDLSSFTTGRFELRRHRMDLGELTSAVVERVRPVADGVGSPLVLDAAAGLVGEWDRVRLEQVVTNLLSNAVKFGAGRPVLVRTRAEGDRAVLAVSDEGPGIPAAILPRIFDRFERGASASHYGGLGIGLYVVREIVEAHGGTFRAENHPTTGATVTVELPLRRAEGA